MRPKYRHNVKKGEKNNLWVIFLVIALCFGSLGFYLGRKSLTPKTSPLAENSQKQPSVESDNKLDSPLLAVWPGEIGKFYSDFSSFAAEDMDRLKVSKKEELVGFITGDVNEDDKSETLVITKNNSTAKGYFYILDEKSSKIYEKSNVLIVPNEVDLRNFGDDLSPSFFLIFKEQYQEGYYIRWNGKKYEVPESERE